MTLSRRICEILSLGKILRIIGSAGETIGHLGYLEFTKYCRFYTDDMWWARLYPH